MLAVRPRFDRARHRRRRAAPGRRAEAIEVRAFFPKDGAVVEDPVTGSLNASLAEWLLRTRPPHRALRRAPGDRARARRARARRRRTRAATIWVGGGTVTCVAGSRWSCTTSTAADVSARLGRRSAVRAGEVRSRGRLSESLRRRAHAPAAAVSNPSLSAQLVQRRSSASRTPSPTSTPPSAAPPAAASAPRTRAACARRRRPAPSTRPGRARRSSPPSPSALGSTGAPSGMNCGNRATKKTASFGLARLVTSRRRSAVPGGGGGASALRASRPWTPRTPARPRRPA